MANLSFNKNSFVNSKTATLSKPINNDPTKLGRRSIDEIRNDMNPFKGKSMLQPKNKQDMKDIQREQTRNPEILRGFREINKK